MAEQTTENVPMCPACGSPIPTLPLTGDDGALLTHRCRCGRTSQPGAQAEQGAIRTVLPDAAMESLCDAFVEANRAEFLDTDFDAPILRAIEALVRQAWHEGYGAGSSAATDGWLDPLAPRQTNPYVPILPPGQRTPAQPEAGDPT